MTRPTPSIRIALAALAAAAALPVSAHAEVFKDSAGVCQITADDDWEEHGNRFVAPTPGFYARVRSGGTAAEVKAAVAAQGGVLVNENAQRALYSAQVQGNKLYWVVTKTTPACFTTVTFHAGAEDAAARRIAESTRRVP